MLAQDRQQQLGRIIAKAWADPAFKERLKADPKEVLAKMGIETPEDVEVEVVENTAAKSYLTLPAAPISDTLNYETGRITAGAMGCPDDARYVATLHCQTNMPNPQCG